MSQETFKLLFDWYAGNPFFLKLIASAIQELFDGNINEFIEHKIVVFGDIRASLDQQFNRLSQLEKHILYLLAVNQDVASVKELQQHNTPGLSPRLSQRLILESIELLQRRSLIERQASSFYLSHVLREYIIEHLIEENFKLSEE